MVLFRNFATDMPDIIHLLSDSVANQIAAGEVVQRPASAVKELLENSIDSGATEITLMIKESGKLLIQVTDNGCGMSERDARMCFERHATSKISKSDDLLNIRTLGFRGEALASIASVAQVELKTKRVEDEIGTRVQVEGTRFLGQSPFNCPNGTTVLVKNLFFNVPARRNFLKSNTLELKHVMEEFFRVALVNPSVQFALYNYDKLQFKVQAGTLKQRIINLFGNSYSQKLIPVEIHTDLVNITGFIGKPEFARKSRSEQYFFTNGRFMRSPYLNNAVERAFQELIPDDATPMYFLYIEVPPQTIDVNIHPTKTEINFQESKSIYAILHSAVKQAIGKFNLAPVLDFEAETGLNIPPPPSGYIPKAPVVDFNPDYNPFTKQTTSQPSFHFPFPTDEKKQKWQEIFSPMSQGIKDIPDELLSGGFKAEESITNKLICEKNDKINGIQLRNSFIVTSTRSGIIIIDQQGAHERILFEKFSAQQEQHESLSQTLMFPQTITLTPDNVALFLEWKDYFTQAGFEINDFGNNSFVIHAFPFQINDPDAVSMFESLLDELKMAGTIPKTNQRLTLAKTMARRLCVKRGKRLLAEETNALIENLFACQVPDLTPDGKPTMMVISFEDLFKKFRIYSQESTT
jgi:DNA mismatch repair protein MutL